MKVPVFELENYPASIIQEYRALNVVSPFTTDSMNIQTGILLSLIRNQNVVKKKDLVSADQILPYLKEYPDYLEHPTIKKVQGLINSCQSNELLADLLEKIAEEIELESNKDKPDEYLISRLSEIYLNNSKATE